MRLDEHAASAASVAVAFQQECMCPPDPHAPAIADQHRLLVLVEQECRNENEERDAKTFGTGVWANLVVLTQHPELRLAAAALCALSGKVQEHLPMEEMLRRYGFTAKELTAKHGLQHLGRALRRPGLITAAEGLKANTVSLMALILMSEIDTWTEDEAAQLTAMKQLHPAAAGCLRLALKHTKPAPGQAIVARCAASLARSAGKDLPGCTPLLLQHLELCRAGLQVDCRASVPDAAGNAPDPDAASPASGQAAPDPAAAVNVAAGWATTVVAAGGGGAAGADASDGGASPSQWARAVSDTLLALTQLHDDGEEAPDAVAQAVLRSTELLISHEVAHRPLPKRGSDAHFVGPDVDILGTMDLRGAAATAAQRSLLLWLAHQLAVAGAAVAAAFPPKHGAAVGDSSPSRGEAGALADDPAAAAGAAHTQAAAGAMPDSAPAATAATSEQAVPCPAFLRPELALMTRLDRLSGCVSMVDDECLSNAQLRALLEPRSQTWQDWAAAVGGALAAAATCFGDDAPETRVDERGQAFVAAAALSRQAAKLLRQCAAAGVQALQRPASVQLMHTLAAHLASRLAITLPYYEASHLALEDVRPTRVAVAAAVEAVLSAGEASSGGAGRAGNRKHQQEQQPPQPVPSTLVEAACACAIALTRDEQRAAIMDIEHEGPEPGYQAVQDSAKLVTRLLHAFPPLAAEHMNDRPAAIHLLNKLEFLLMLPWKPQSQVVPAVASLCQPLVLLIQQDPAIHRVWAAPGRSGRLSWPELADQLKQQARQQPARRVLVDRALASVTQAMEDTIRGVPLETLPTVRALCSWSPPENADAPAAAGLAGAGAAAAAEAAAPMQPTTADADAAMAALLAEEEGRMPADTGAPSKAALKRARKKAAAAAAAEGLAPQAAADISAHPSPSCTVPTSALAATAAAAAQASASGMEAAAADAASAAAATTPGPSVNDAAAAQNSMQQLRLRDGTAASSAPPAPESPGWMMCPLSHALMVDPVLCIGDGQTYERAAITQWLAASNTSPVTGQPLASLDLLPNHALRSIIQAAQARSARQQG